MGRAVRKSTEHDRTMGNGLVTGHRDRAAKSVFGLCENHVLSSSVPVTR